jgi:hypothetical protein
MAPANRDDLRRAFFARTVSAQSGSMVRGRILDPSNAGIPAAVVHLDHTDTGVRTSVSADASGEDTVPALPLGDYRLEVSAPGFQTRVDGPVARDLRVSSCDACPSSTSLACVVAREWMPRYEFHD